MLIVGWPASRDWVLARREAEVIRRRLETKALEWSRLGRGAGGLLDADELPEGDRWLASPDALELGIDSDVKDLVAASRASLDAQGRRSPARTRALIGSLAAVVVVVASLALWGEVKRREATKAQHEAEVSAKESTRRLVRMNISNGNRLLADRDLPGALLWYVEAFKNDRKNVAHEETHRARIGAVLRQCPSLLKVWTSREGDLYTEADADGDRVATVLADGTARVWDIATAQPVSPPLKHESPVRTLAFSPNGQILATAAEDATVRVWNAKTGEPIAGPLAHAGKIERLIFNQDVSQLAVVYDNDAWQLWHLPDGHTIGDPQRIGMFPRSGEPPRRPEFEFSPDGTKVAIAEPNRVVIRETRVRPVGPAPVQRRSALHLSVDVEPR